MLPTPPPSPQLSTTCLSPEDRLGCVLADRLELVSVLGVGAYGVVYEAIDIFTNITYAVKALPKAGLDARQQRFQRREIALHFHASHHPNVVSLTRILDSPDCTFVVLEYCPEGDLFSNITERGRFVGDDALAKYAFIQILDAVRHCHALGIYHRDLKPENILVSDYGQTMKLADFGLATTDKITSDLGCGSTFYMSPECQNSSSRLRGRYASAPNDVWSLGVILVNLTCGRNPWKKASPDDPTFRAFQHDPAFLGAILPISRELNYILGRVFDLNPRTRISILELRSLILSCPRFTINSRHELPSLPIPCPAHDAMDLTECTDKVLPPSPPVSPQSTILDGRPADWALFPPHSKRSSASSSSASTDSYYDMIDTPHEPQPYNFYGNMLSCLDHQKQFCGYQYQPPSIATY